MKYKWNAGEYEVSKNHITKFDWDGNEFSVSVPKPTVIEVELYPEDVGEIKVSIFGEVVIVKGKFISYKEKIMELQEVPKEIHIFADKKIMEIYIEHGIGKIYFETDCTELTGSVKIKGFKGKGNIYTCQS